MLQFRVLETLYNEGPAASARVVVNVMLSPEGQRIFPDTFRKHSKVVKAKMRALEGREQHTLSRLCQKLRRGDVLRFVQEFRSCDWDVATDQKWRVR